MEDLKKSFESFIEATQAYDEAESTLDEVRKKANDFVIAIDKRQSAEREAAKTLVERLELEISELQQTISYTAHEKITALIRGGDSVSTESDSAYSRLYQLQTELEAAKAFSCRGLTDAEEEAWESLYIEFCKAYEPFEQAHKARSKAFVALKENINKIHFLSTILDTNTPFYWREKINRKC